MDFNEFLRERRASLIANWREAILDSYTPEAKRFFKREKSPFANPVGSVLTEGLEAMYDLLAEKNSLNDSICLPLENIIRVRAIQDLTPSQAVGFILGLKEIVAKAINRESPVNGLWSDFRDFEKKVDEVALMAFDIYAHCRHKIYELRVNEVKGQVGRLLQRANLLREMSDAAPAPGP